MKKQIRIALAGIFTLALVATTAVPTLAEPIPASIQKPDKKPETHNTFTHSGDTYTVNGVSFKMVTVQGGTFTMGSTIEYAYDDEMPIHSVTLPTYDIGQT